MLLKKRRLFGEPKEIGLRLCCIGLEDAQGIADVVQSDPTLASVTIRNVHIDHQGMKAIFNSFRDSKSITAIDFGFNGFGSAGAMAIADVLKHNKSIVS